MFQSFSLPIAFSGPRALPVEAIPLVYKVVQEVMLSGRSVVVGCAVGADAAVLSAAIRFCPVSQLASRIQVLCAFGPEGQGSFVGSSVAGVQAAAALGVPVIWWAGGGPAVALVQRLRSRSQACVHASMRLIAFLVPGLPCRGTRYTITFAHSVHEHVELFWV